VHTSHVRTYTASYIGCRLALKELLTDLSLYDVAVEVAIFRLVWFFIIEFYWHKPFTYLESFDK